MFLLGATSNLHNAGAMAPKKKDSGKGAVAPRRSARGKASGKANAAFKSPLTAHQLNLGNELGLQVRKTRGEVGSEFYQLLKIEGARQAAVVSKSLPSATVTLCSVQKNFYQELSKCCKYLKSASSMIADIAIAKKVVIYGNIDIPHRPAIDILKVYEDGKDAHELAAWKNYGWSWLAVDNDVRKAFKSELFSVSADPHHSDPPLPHPTPYSPLH